MAEILRELGVAADGLKDSRSRTPADSARILQIRVEETSSPDNPRYALDAAVFSMASGSRQRIMSWQCGEGCSLDDIEDVGGRFLEQTAELERSVSEASHLMVEFLLPWSLLGHPVERWRLDEDGFWIGHTFPVVVRSLDRQRKKFFYQPWRHRWDLLSGHNAGRPVGQQIGWLCHGNSAVPVQADRVIQLTGRNSLTQWLAKEENSGTAALGLTFSYQPGDPASVNALKGAVHEGIPLLIWLRGDGDVSQLERLLEDVDPRDLPGKVYEWRRQTANFDATTSDARYHVVLLWDDPSGAGRSSEALAAP